MAPNHIKAHYPASGGQKKTIRFVGEGRCDIPYVNGEMEPSSSQNGTGVLLFMA